MTKAQTFLTSKQMAVGSVLVSLVVLTTKYLAYAMTNSVGLYSDALESLVNIAASFAVVIAVWLVNKPADDNHPFGHHKAEYLSAVLEGVLIVIAAIAIFREAYYSAINPHTLSVPMSGLLLNALAGVINGAWAFVLVHQGRRLRSPALVADGKHLYTDVVSSIGVLGGVIIALVTGYYWLDPLLAVMVGVSILWTGWGLIRNSLGGLMDEAIDEEEQEKIREIITANAYGAIEAHDLRTRHSGRVIFVEFHLVVPSAMLVFEAHEICDRIELALKKDMPYVNVIIHVEPADKAHAPNVDGSMVF